MHEQIATYLETDEDFCSFTLICPESHNSAHSARSGVWRALYANRFDLSGQKDSKLLMTEYMRRSRELRRGARFEMGQTRQEINCMEILRALVIGEMTPHMCLWEMAKVLTAIRVLCRHPSWRESC